MNKEIVQYEDIVVMVHESIQDVTGENECDFHTNLSLYLEGLEEDVTVFESDLQKNKAEHAKQNIACRPKEWGDDS
tara:strand:- start:221 stop:448 length:228 start_codon:yes stop_codon:yes gene_type:complete